MKMSKIGLVSLAILGFAFLAPVPVRASSTANWLNTLNSTGDPLGLSNAYTTGSNLNLQVVLQNPFGSSIKIIYAQLGMDWGTNYTDSGISNTNALTIPAFGQAVIAFSGSGTSPSFTAPSTTPGSSPFASNLVSHNAIFSWTFFNITQSFCSGVNGHQCFLENIVGIPPMAVYSSDQAGAIAALEQVYPIVISGGGGLISANSTTQARYDALQAYLYYSQGTQAYQTFNFNTSKTDWQSSYTWWKQAVTAQNSTETSKTSTVNSNNTSALNNGALGGYGTILLGVGIVLAGAGVLVYGIRRPKASMAPH